MAGQGAATKILIAEDEALLLYSVSEELRGAGFDVLEATSADSALLMLSEHDDIDVLFTDIDMPGSMNGLDLCDIVRDRWPPVRIAITSGKFRQQVGDLGVYLPKPYSIDVLVGTLRSLASG